MFLSGEELQDLGIDPNETDCVAYAVRDGRLRVVGEELDMAADSGAGGITRHDADACPAPEP